MTRRWPPASSTWRSTPRSPARARPASARSIPRGLLGAAFVYRTSRAGDPQLHTHVLVSGRLRCQDGTWRALDSRAMHRELKPAGLVYHAALRAESETRLGVVWGPVDRNGQADIQGVPEALMKHYSKRCTAVEAEARARIAESEHILERSLTPQERRRTYERAVLDTRDAKDHAEVFDEGLHDRWHADADAAGFAPETSLGDVVDRRGPQREVTVEAVVAESLAELARASSTWGRRHVVQQVACRAPAGLATAGDARRWVEQVPDEVLAHPRVVRLVAPGPEVPEYLRRRDGRSVYEAHGAPRYSTLATLATEQQVLDLVLAGREAGRGVASASTTEAVVAEANLAEDQAQAVRRLCLGGEAVTALIGPAGSGKSHTMGAAAQAWEDCGIPVRGLALSAAAGGVLEFEAGIASETIAKFLFEHDRPEGPSEQWRLHRGEVVVIDEAAMVASADLARVVVLASEAQAKVVLVGDHRQLGAVEAGGLFRLLVADTEAAELTACGASTPPGSERPACACATATGPSSRTISSSDASWAASER